MKTYLYSLVAAAALCAGLATAGAAPAADANQAVRDADGKLLQALAGGDQKSLGALLDGAFTWTDAAGMTRGRAEVLKQIPAPAAGTDAQTGVRVYGEVGVVRADLGKTHALRVWVKRKAGWRALLVHEVTQRDTPAPSAGAGSDVCDNPCKGIPYKAKTAAERGIIKSWQELETAVTTHDADAWAPHFLDEFVLIGSNGVEPATKVGRMAVIRRQKEEGKGSAPSPLAWAQMFNFGDTVVMVSRHQPANGRPLRVSRVWVKGTATWQMAISFQTAVQ